MTPDCDQNPGLGPKTYTEIRLDKLDRVLDWNSSAARDRQNFPFVSPSNKPSTRPRV